MSVVSLVCECCDMNVMYGDEDLCLFFLNEVVENYVCNLV